MQKNYCMIMMFFKIEKWIIFNPNTKFVYVYENRQILPKMKYNCYLVIE